MSLTCTRDSANNVADVYEWILPDGSEEPAGSSPVVLEITSISRNQSGVYTCAGESSDTIATVSRNITLNVQCELLYFTCTST